MDGRGSNNLLGTIGSSNILIGNKASVEQEEDVGGGIFE